MALTKLNTDVTDIPNVTVSLQTDTTSSGVGVSKANLTSPAFTGSPNVPSLSAWKNVRVATAASITTLSGLLTIDGKVTSPGNRVLVKNHTTASSNGIYEVRTGSWVRTTDADTSGEFSTGKFVFVEEGSINSGDIFELTTSGGITLGTTSLTFATTWIDVRVATTTTSGNIATLAGGAPNTLDGVSLATNDRVLVKNQTTGSQNGIYVVTTLGTGSNGTWTRASDADTSIEFSTGKFVFVTEGTENAGDAFELTTTGTITLGTTSLTFAVASKTRTLERIVTTGYTEFILQSGLKYTSFAGLQTAHQFVSNEGNKMIHFEIGGEEYMAVANAREGGTGNRVLGANRGYFHNSASVGTYAGGNVKIYKWLGSETSANGLYWSLHQTINVPGSWDIDYFIIGSDSYLAIASFHDGTDFDTTSYLFKWNTTNGRFGLVTTTNIDNPGVSGPPDTRIAQNTIQSITTNGCTRVNTVTFGSDTFMVMCNYFSTSAASHLLTLWVGKWNGTTFTQINTSPNQIDTKGCTSADFVVANNNTELYLMVINHRDNTGTVPTSYEQISKIYKWDSANNRFDVTGGNVQNVTTSTFTSYASVSKGFSFVDGAGTNQSFFFFGRYDANTVQTGDGNQTIFKWTSSSNPYFSEYQTLVGIPGCFFNVDFFSFTNTYNDIVYNFLAIPRSYDSDFFSNATLFVHDQSNGRFVPITVYSSNSPSGSTFYKRTRDGELYLTACINNGGGVNGTNIEQPAYVHRVRFT